MNKSPTIRVGIWLTIGVLFPMPLSAYELLGQKWPSPTTTFFVDIVGANGLWNDAFESAMGQWSNSTSFVYLISRGTFEHPCNANGRNGVGWTSDVCGDAYGSNTLAVAQRFFSGSTLSETDIVFNINESWDVYSGPYFSGTWSGINDFHRVAVHELGHALGLDHEDDVPAIMATLQAVGNTLIAPTADDIAGVNAIYGGGGGGVDLTGSLEDAGGTPLCALVLASGQFMFTCNPNGPFSLLDLPRENDGTVKRQVYVDGFFPNVEVLQASVDETVVMTRAGTCPDYNSSPDPGVFPDSAGKQFNISGRVLLQNTQTPICAMVLANGQFGFTCDGTGSYSANIPLDANGQFKLQVYAEGFAPTIQTFDEFQAMNDVRMARAVECQ